MSITVGFIHEGFLVAATADSTGVALSQLEDSTGVPAREYWGRAIDYFRWREELNSAVEGVPRGDTARRVSGDVEPVPTDQDGTTTKEDDKGRSTATHVEHTGGAGSSMACNVCTAEVTPDLAEVSKQRFGSILCRGCGNW